MLRSFRQSPDLIRSHERVTAWTRERFALPPDAEGVQTPVVAAKAAEEESAETRSVRSATRLAIRAKTDHDPAHRRASGSCEFSSRDLSTIALRISIDLLDFPDYGRTRTASSIKRFAGKWSQTGATLDAIDAHGHNRTTISTRALIIH